MKWFKKTNKVKKEDDGENNSEINKAEYNIVLLEKLGGTVREIKSFNAQRWIDEEDHVVYLKNDKLKFLEIFPQQINDFRTFTEVEVDKLIKQNQDIIEKERVNNTEKINDKEIEHNLLKLRAKKRSFKFNNDASYLSFNAKAQPTFYLLREGSTFFPFRWDTETKTIFVPSDNRKKSARLSLSNKDTKYSTTKLVTGAAILLILIAFGMFAAAGYGLVKVNKMEQELFVAYDTSEIAEAKRQSLEVANACALATGNIANSVKKIVDDIDEELNKPQTIIEGFIPE